MNKPCPNCGRPMAKKTIIAFSMGDLSRAEEEILRGHIEASNNQGVPLPQDVIDRFGFIKWECEPCLLTMEEPKVVDKPASSLVR